MQLNNDEKQPSRGNSKPSGSLDALTQERATKSNAIEVPQISLPKGGGALKGIDEKFQVNPSNGTSSFSIPLPLSPNRNGFTPALSISYNSGAGNSVLGIGWGLDFPSIQRKTDKKLPRYTDEDTFMFSGVEDLVPVLKKTDEGWVVDEFTEGNYFVRRYRPRIEGAFSRIERIQHAEHGMYWRITTRDNVTTIFGRSPECRIVDPEEDSRIFQWLPEMSFDDKGSVVVFKYKEEDLTGIEQTLPEKNRLNGTARFVNRYLKKVLYGNASPFYPYDLPDASPYDPPLPADNSEWHFEGVFDYGEHDPSAPRPDDAGDWVTRPDPFSIYRSGFEIRTYRLLKRVLMFHRFPELNDGTSTLVRSLDFKHLLSDTQWSERETELEFLVSMTQSGYIRRSDGTYSKKSLPPMEFNYQPLRWNHEVREVQQKDLVHAPVGLSGNYQWVDLYNEGINGILTEQGGGWYYKHNLGDTDGNGQVSFENAHLVAPKPSFTGLSNGVLQLQDLEANGQKQIVVNAPGMQGYFELTDEGDWEPFRAFLNRVNINLRDPNVRVFDINGDGQPEIVLTEEQAFCWWPAEGKEGYGAPERSFKPFDDEQGPAIVFSDPEQRIFLADMSGDGLTDIVRIRNGEVCYWPNLGYGRFGAKVAMSDAPWFDHPDQFNPAYLQLSDISGTGATDLIYLGKNQFRAWLNLSGNRWGQAEEIVAFFPVEQPNRVTVTDLLGTGTACIVWSSELPAYSGAPMRYMDLMGGEKPHIMTGYRNNFGKAVTMQYKSSTHFYLKDKTEGHPWITRLPFPVQVVERVEVRDEVTGALFVNQYAYHHGYYDHTEREFRGFGRVDQLDTEDYEAWKIKGAANALPPEHHEPPELTRTWFHTGAFLGKEKILRQFEQEYWCNTWNRLHPDAPVTEHILPDALIDTSALGGEVTLSAEELCEALRACKGMTLRQEVFAMDGSEKERLPYTVATHNCHIHLVQPRGNNRHASFMALESEAMNWSYERNPVDPRVGHTFNMEVDELGNVLQAASVVYPRKAGCHSVLPGFKLTKEDIGDKDPEDMQVRHQDFLDAVQHQLHVTLTENDFTKDVLAPGAYRLRMPAAVRTYEVKGLGLPQDEYFSLDVLRAAIQKAVATPYEDTDAPASEVIEKRLIEKVCTRYRRNDLSGPLDENRLESLALPFESYQLAFTPALLRQLYAEKLPEENWAAVLETQGRFERMDRENWWISSGKTLYPDLEQAKAQFYLPDGYEDPFEAVTKVYYDEPHYLTAMRATDALGNETAVEHFNYRTLAPERLRDPNGNFSEALSDELGLPIATAIFSKADTAGWWEGDTLDAGNWDFTPERIAAFFENPRAAALNLLQTATTCLVYDFNRIPAKVATIARETHFHSRDAEGKPQTNPTPQFQVSLEYSDGLGQVALKKVQAEPGKAWQVEQDAQGSCKVQEVAADPRWVGNGRTILNNKGKPVRQYEPYFSDTHIYEDEACVREMGVTPVLHYDPVGRVIRTDMPNGTFSKVEFDAWEQRTYDPNDTIGTWKADGTLENTCLWYNARITGTLGVAEQRAAEKAAVYADTPEPIYLDSLGRPVYSLAHNRWEAPVNNHTEIRERYHPTLVVLDVEGNVLEIKDARDNLVMTYQHDMLGHRLNQNSMDAGRRWMLHDCLGQPLYAWDERHFIFSYAYDVLHRPTESRVQGGDGLEPLDHIYQKILYGEGQGDAAFHNLRGQVWRLYDTAGCVETPDYDFKGNPLRSTRRLAHDYKTTPNWLSDPEPLLEAEIFTTAIQYDAMNRVVRSTTPDGSATIPGFNETGLLEKVEVIQDAVTRTMVANINYNEKGQRTKIQYGNGVITTYAYDPQTFRLIHLNTYRNGNALPAERLLQDLYYTYDPGGNITHIEDRAIPTVFFNNFKVEPAAQYTYDALYQLIAATGREHIGQAAHGEQDNWDDTWAKDALQPNSPVQLRPYTQRFQYDPAGNIQQMRHQANDGSWTRDYAYEDQNNRLKTTIVGARTYPYPHHPQHGYMTALPHLQRMDWNFLEQLQATSKQRLTNGGAPETTWYVYDGDGQRVRKVTENAADPGKTPSRKNERIYLDSSEVYRQYSGDEAGLERWTLHVTDDKQRIALIETRNAVDDGTAPLLLRYQLGNHLGSAVLEVDEGAQVISYEEFHPYGTTAYQAMNAAIKSAGKRYRYTGMERDEETGLSLSHGAVLFALVGEVGEWRPKNIN